MGALVLPHPAIHASHVAHPKETKTIRRIGDLA
jgi:hypothetical protein